MIKNVLIICMGLFVVITVLVLKPIRTDSVLLDIATKELQETLFLQFGKERYLSIESKLTGPLVKYDADGNRVMYEWYYLSKQGDSAFVYITVYRHPESFSWRDGFYWNRVTMNSNWGQ